VTRIDATGVGTLMQATGGHPAGSDHYRDIFAPLGLQNEIRAVLRVRDPAGAAPE
jgi:hypothetical protein